MRVIDADKMIDQFSDGESMESMSESIHNKRFVKALQDAPTVDAVVLPCKVGDIVWILGDRFPAEIEEIIIKEDGVFFEYVEFDRSYEITEIWDGGRFHVNEFGKKVFLTFEEAEAALAKMDGDGNG